MEKSRRWTITYTKHVHQKRKVYQDGLLELDGPKNKIFLYDDNEKLLDSRYLKKDEVIANGGTLAFSSYIVDVGDCEEKNKPISDLVVNDMDKRSSEKRCIKRQSSLHNSSGIKRVVHDDQSAQTHQGESENYSKEWNALYTTQLTQKFKKYHDGILQLSGCGSHIMQVFLLSEDGSILSSKYMKSAEPLKAGVSIELPNYLVQICEPRNFQGDDQGENNSTRSSSVGPSNLMSLPVKKKCVKSTSLMHSKEESKENMLVEAETSCTSQVGKIPWNIEVPRSKPFREVFQILSRLQKTEESYDHEMSSKKQDRASKFRNPLMLDAQKKDKISCIMALDVEKSKTLANLDLTVDNRNFNQNGSLHMGTMRDIIEKVPDSQHEQKPDDSLDSASSRSLSLESQFHKEYPMNSESIQYNPNAYVGGTTESNISPHDGTAGASCGSTQVLRHWKDEISNQHAGITLNVREETNNVPSVGMSPSVQSSFPVAATLPSGSSLESSGKEGLPDEIPSFDLGI